MTAGHANFVQLDTTATQSTPGRLSTATPSVDGRRWCRTRPPGCDKKVVPASIRPLLPLWNCECRNLPLFGKESSRLPLSVHLELSHGSLSLAFIPPSISLVVWRPLTFWNPLLLAQRDFGATRERFLLLPSSTAVSLFPHSYP